VEVTIGQEDHAQLFTPVEVLQLTLGLDEVHLAVGGGDVVHLGVHEGLDLEMLLYQVLQDGEG